MTVPTPAPTPTPTEAGEPVRASSGPRRTFGLATATALVMGNVIAALVLTPHHGGMPMAAATAPIFSAGPSTQG
jgi:hypothetical protein